MQRRLPFLLVLLAVVQVLSVTYGLDVPLLAALCPFLFLSCGATIGLLLLQTPATSSKVAKPSTRALLVIIALLIATAYFIGGNFIRTAPLTVEQADMLPIIKVMGQRFLAGEPQTVYAPIPEIWNGIQPIYPPVMWGSFLPAVGLDVDLRWVTLAGIVLAALACLYPLLRSGGSLRLSLLLGFAVMLLLLWLYTNNSHNVIRLTEEGVVYCWYCLLVYAVISNNGWVIGAAAALCLLTRYSMIGWLPAVALWWWINGERKTVLRAAASGSITLLLLLLPFGLKPVEVLLNLPSSYVAHAQRVWDEFPLHFYHSPGMAKFFGRDGAATLHFTLIASSFLAPLLMVMYVLWRRKRQQLHNVPLALLVVKLTVFYAFVDVPYLYLYYTPVFVSLAAVGLALNSRPLSTTVRPLEADA